MVDSRIFADRGIGSLLETSVISLGFQGDEWGSDPPLSVFLSVRARRYRVRDGQMVEEKEFRYRGSERKFAEWMSDGAALTKEEFQRGYAHVSGDIVRDMICHDSISLPE